MILMRPNTIEPYVTKYNKTIVNVHFAKPYDYILCKESINKPGTLHTISASLLRGTQGMFSFDGFLRRKVKFTRQRKFQASSTTMSLLKELSSPWVCFGPYMRLGSERTQCPVQIKLSAAQLGVASSDLQHTGSLQPSPHSPATVNKARGQVYQVTSHPEFTEGFGLPDLTQCSNDEAQLTDCWFGLGCCGFST